MGTLSQDHDIYPGLITLYRIYMAAGRVAWASFLFTVHTGRRLPADRPSLELGLGLGLGLRVGLGSGSGLGSGLGLGVEVGVGLVGFSLTSTHTCMQGRIVRHAAK